MKSFADKVTQLCNYLTFIMLLELPDFNYVLNYMQGYSWVKI